MSCKALNCTKEKIEVKFQNIINPITGAWGHIWPPKLWTDIVKIAWGKNIFNLYLFLAKGIRIISCERFLSKKCCSKRFFNQKVRALTCLWWRFCALQTIWCFYDSQATNRSAPWGGGGLAASPPCLLLVAWEWYITPSRMVRPVYITCAVSLSFS